MSEGGAMDPSVVRTYGGWREETPVGLGAFSLTQSLSLMATGFALVVVNVLLGWVWSLSLGSCAAVVAFVAVVRDRYGMNWFDRRRERMRFSRAKRTGKTSQRAGVMDPSGRTQGRCRLPGVLGRVELTSHVDAYRRPFGLLHHPDGHLTVVLGIAPEGERLKDKAAIDTLVGCFGAWLACLPNEVGVLGASITVETSPETGESLRAKVRAQRSPEAPLIAQQIIEGVIARADYTDARVSCWATLSFDPSKLGKGERAVEEIATRLPALTQTLVAGGAGAVHVMDTPDITRVARVAYDPGVESLMEAAASKGQSVELDWEDTGPIANEEGWSMLRHDSAVSCSWVQRGAPRGTVQHTALRRLLEPTKAVPRKRVTMIYRPLNPSRAAEAAEKSIDRAINRLRLRGKRATARLERDLSQAVQTSQEEAGGAAIVDFALLVTATASGPNADEQIVDAVAAVESLAGASRFTMRPAYGCQGAAFAMSLPLGIMPHQQSTLAGL